MRIVKIIALVVAVLLVLGGGAAAWFITRPPKPAKILDPQPQGRRVVENNLFANYYPAPGPGSKPGILLLGGSEGGLSRDVLRQAVLLQAQGYHVLHLAYHNAPGRPADIKNVPLEDFIRGLEWLKSQPKVDRTALAIIGYSKGAEAALLVATRYKGLRAVVAGMPSSVAWDGLDTPSILFGLNASWSEAGEPLPSLGYGSFDSERGLYGVFEDGLKQREKHPDTIIPIERFTGRLLMVCGAMDSLWPACPMAEQVKARAAASGRPATTLLAYKDAGHGVMGAPGSADDADIKRFAELGGTAAANAAARTDSWAKITAFLKDALAPS